MNHNHPGPRRMTVSKITPGLALWRYAPASVFENLMAWGSLGVFRDLLHVVPACGYWRLLENLYVIVSLRGRGYSRTSRGTYAFHRDLFESTDSNMDIFSVSV
jgi:hypothetical protein